MFANHTISLSRNIRDFQLAIVSTTEDAIKILYKCVLHSFSFC